MKQPPEKPSSSLMPFILGAIERNLSNLAAGGMYSSSFLTTSRTDLAPHIGIISISVATPRLHKNTTNQGPRNRWLVSPWWDSQGISRKKLLRMGSSPRYQRLKYGGLRMVKIIQLVDMELFLQKSWKDREKIKDEG